MTSARRGLIAAVLVVVVAGCSFFSASSTPAPTGTAAPTASPTRTLRPTRTPRPTPSTDAGPTTTPRPRHTPRPTKVPAPTPTPLPSLDIPGLAGLLGSDGRFTILFLGSDAGRSRSGERTDAIIVASIDPNTGKVVMASLPRDTIDVPIGPGNAYGPKVTGLFQDFESRSGGRTKAFKRMVNALEYAFGIEIDHYALVGFVSLEHLVKAVGGVDVYMQAPLVDLSAHYRHGGRRGLIMKKGWNHLSGKKALAFARSRHTDSDYARARRQQQLIAAAIGKVLHGGIDTLPALARLVERQLETDIPLSQTPALFALAQRARLKNFKSVVLGPSTYSTEVRATYSNVLKMDVVRAFFARAFAPVAR